MGYAKNADFNGQVQEGFGYYQVSQKNGARYGAGRAYIGDRPRANLTVMTDMEVARILFDGRRAIGVLVRGAAGAGQGGAAPEHAVLARGEVIVSGGAFGSPQLLMCSGVGPAAHLRAHGIAVVQDSPDVGGNLQDHVDYTINRRVRHRSLFGATPGMLPDILRGWRDYKRDGTGMLTTNVAESGGFLRSAPDVDAARYTGAFLHRHRRRSWAPPAHVPRHVRAYLRAAAEEPWHGPAGECGHARRSGDRPEFLRRSA